MNNQSENVRIKDHLLAALNTGLQLRGFDCGELRLKDDGTVGLWVKEGYAPPTEDLPRLTLNIIVSNDKANQEPRGLTHAQAIDLRKWWFENKLNESGAKVFYLPVSRASLWRNGMSSEETLAYLESHIDLESVTLIDPEIFGKERPAKGFGGRGKTVRQRAKEIGIDLPKNAASQVGKLVPKSSTSPVLNGEKVKTIPANVYKPVDFPIVDAAIEKFYSQSLEAKLAQFLAIDGNRDLLSKMPGGQDLIEVIEGHSTAFNYLQNNQ